MRRSWKFFGNKWSSRLSCWLDCRKLSANAPKGCLQSPSKLANRYKTHKRAKEFFESLGWCTDRWNWSIVALVFDVVPENAQNAQPKRQRNDSDGQKQRAWRAILVKKQICLFRNKLHKSLAHQVETTFFSADWLPFISQSTSEMVHKFIADDFRKHGDESENLTRICIGSRFETSRVRRTFAFKNSRQIVW